LFTCNKQ